MRSYNVKENNIGRAVSDILWYKQTDRDPVTFIRIGDPFNFWTGFGILQKINLGIKIFISRVRPYNGHFLTLTQPNLT